MLEVNQVEEQSVDGDEKCMKYTTLEMQLCSCSILSCCPNRNMHSLKSMAAKVEFSLKILVFISLFKNICKVPKN